MKFFKFIIALNKHLNNFFVDVILSIGFVLFPLFLWNINLFGLDKEIGNELTLGWAILMYVIYAVITFIGLMLLVAGAVLIDVMHTWWNETLTPAVNKAKEDTESFEIEPKVTFK